MIRIHPEWRYDPFGPFDTCPQCLGPLTAVAIHEHAEFYCTPCDACWHVALGYLTRLDPPRRRGALVRREDVSNATVGAPAPTASVGAT
jgi:hypothetical protein